MDVFDLQAKISLDSREYQTALKDAESKFGKVGDSIKSALGTITKTTAAAVGAGAVATGKIVSDAVKSFGDYEQLTGGIDTLFGASSDAVMKNAEKAFQTAGMSMNDYMETSIQSAASLINSLEGDQAKAAELMDLSITDMADNVNKMGTSMEGVQNAYRGFSRGNFTMLDNLALGFAGTKEGMQELLDKAHELSGVDYDIDSYSDIVQAIHVVQKEMGITGTTAKEAAGTIQGSVGAMKAAWEDLKVNLVSEDGDLGKSIDTLFDSALTVFDNIEPKIEQAVGGVGAFVEKAAPLISDKLPPIIEKIMPSLLETGATLVTSIGKGVAKAIPSLLSSGKSLISGVYSDFKNADLGSFDWMREDIVRIVDAVQGKIGDINLDGLKPLADWAMNDALPAAFDAIAGSVEFLGKALDVVKPVAKDVWEHFLKPVGEWTADAATAALETLGKVFEKVGKALDGVDWSGFWDEIGSDEFWTDFDRGWKDITENVDKAGDAVDEFFSVNKYAQTWNDFWQGVGGTVYSFWTETMKPFLEDAVDGFKEVERWGGKLYDKISDIKTGVGELWDKWNETFGAVGGAAYDLTHDSEGGLDVFEILRKLTNIDFMASGGQLTSGQAIIAEAGPELLSVRNGVATVTPLSNKASNTEVARRSDASPVYNITVNVQSMNNQSDIRRAAHLLGQELEQERIRYQRAVGGVGW